MEEKNMNKIAIAVLSAAATVFATGAYAADAAAGKAKAASCAGCHGLNGVSNNPMYPNLAAQKEVYLVKSIKDYRDGKRKDAMMEGMAQGLTDDDIANLAAFYASQKP
jgi:cytochrome c553